MQQFIATHGAPAFIRSKNDSEFIRNLLGELVNEQDIKTLYKDPSSPWQNGYTESFHGEFMNECLGREIFYTLTKCQVVVNDWKRQYNQVRPHRSLGMQTPLVFAMNISIRSRILSAHGLNSEAFCTTAPS